MNGIYSSSSVYSHNVSVKDTYYIRMYICGSNRGISSSFFLIDIVRAVRTGLKLWRRSLTPLPMLFEKLALVKVHFAKPLTTECFSRTVHYLLAFILFVHVCISKPTQLFCLCTTPSRKRKGVWRNSIPYFRFWV